MTIEEFDVLSAKVNALGARYLAAGLAGSIPEELKIEFEAANDEYIDACRQYFDMLRAR